MATNTNLRCSNWSLNLIAAYIKWAETNLSNPEPGVSYSGLHMHRGDQTKTITLDELRDDCIDFDIHQDMESLQQTPLTRDRNVRCEGIRALSDVGQFARL